MRFIRSIKGQTTSEYVGIIAIVGVIFAVALPSLGGPPLAEKIIGGIRHGICKVSFGICTSEDAKKAGLSACTTSSHVEGERVGASIVFIRLEHGTTMGVQRRSDGTTSVSFIKDFKGGGETGIGLNIGSSFGETSAKAGAGVKFRSGNSYEFPSFAAAKRFISRYAADETLKGEAHSLLNEVCIFCSDKKDHRPKPHATYHEGGVYGELRGSFKAAGLKKQDGSKRGAKKSKESSGPLLGEASINLEGSALLGRRVQGDRKSLYIRASADLAGQLGSLIGSLKGGVNNETVLEYTTSRGKPVELKVIGTAAAKGDINFSPLESLPELAKKLRGNMRSPYIERATEAVAKRIVKKPKKKSKGTPGKAIEAHVSLDLTNKENLDTVKGFLDIFRAKAPIDTIGDRVGSLARQLDQQGKFDVRIFRTVSSNSNKGAEASLIAKLGGSYDKTKEVRTLTNAWSRISGGPLRQREDCVKTISG